MSNPRGLTMSKRTEDVKKTAAAQKVGKGTIAKILKYKKTGRDREEKESRGKQKRKTERFFGDH